MLSTRLLFLFLFFQQLLIAQQFSYRNITPIDGLPSSEVYDILQDRKGYMWFATDHGVARYNGKEFTNYTTEDGLLDNTVFRMSEDSKGRIWFISQSNEVCYWENNVIYKTPVSFAVHKKIRPEDVVRRFYMDASDNLWFGCADGTFVSKAKNNYTTLDFVDVFTINGINIKILDNKFAMYLSRRWGFISKLQPEPFKIIVATQFDKDVVYRTIEVLHSAYSRHPSFTSCAYSGKNKSIFHSVDSTIFIIQENKKIPVKHLKNMIIQLTIDDNNDLWVNYKNKGVDFFKNCDLNSNPIHILDGYTPDDEFVDHEGGIWIATLEKGVFYIPSTTIFNYKNIPLLNGRISFIGDWKNKVVVSTFSDMVYEENDKHFTPIDFLCAYGKSEGNLNAIKTIRDTTYASFDSHLERFTTESKTKSINKNSVNWFGGGKDFFEGPDHGLWLRTSGTLTKVNTYLEQTERLIAPFRITCSAYDGKNMYVGGKKGLYLFKDKKFISLSYKDSLLSSQIAQIAIDKNDCLWLATSGRGLLKLKDNKVIQFNKKDGLISNVCTAVSIDDYGNIWVGTNKGLSCIRQTTKKKEKWIVKNITDQNGLSSNEILKLFAQGNSIWVGTLEGLCHIDIKGSLPSIVPPLVYISSIKVNDSLVTTQNRFPYNKNNLKFTLDPLTFKSKDHLFRYRIIELNNTWQETKTGEIIFNTLPPGNYTFEAQAANIDKIWSHKSATYSFTIDKPFWLAWWFILLEILIAALVVYLIILWRTSIIRKKEQEKLRINKLLAEYQMKALTAQMNPHFIFNAINSIQNFIIQNHSTLAYDYLIKFSKLIRMVLNNSKDNEISIRQELETLAIYTELEQLRFENSFNYQVSIAPELDIDSLVIPALLLQPYIENAIWHGLMPLKNRKGTITLTIIDQDGFLKITIIDNGVGRAASDLIKKKIVNKNHQSMGMELTGKRIEVFGQESKFSLQIIDNYSDTNEPQGTTVEIILPMIEMY